MAENSIEKKAEELLSKIIQDMGYDLYVKEGKEYHLCIYIEKKEGININDCEKVTDVINPILDSEDFIKNQYYLEVSSSGLEKKLRKRKHFEKQIGNKIEVKLFTKINNKKDYEGILKEYNENFLILNHNGKDVEIELDKIASAKSVYDWNNQ